MDEPLVECTGAGAAGRDTSGALRTGAGALAWSCDAGSSTFTEPVENARHNDAGRPVAASTPTAITKIVTPRTHDGIARQKGRRCSRAGAGAGAEATAARSRQLSIERGGEGAGAAAGGAAGCAGGRGR